MKICLNCPYQNQDNATRCEFCQSILPNTCPNCTFENKEGAHECEICEKPLNQNIAKQPIIKLNNPAQEEQELDQKEAKEAKLVHVQEDVCPECTFLNPKNSIKCEICGTILNPGLPVQPPLIDQVAKTIINSEPINNWGISKISANVHSQNEKPLEEESKSNEKKQLSQSEDIEMTNENENLSNHEEELQIKNQYPQNSTEALIQHLITNDKAEEMLEKKQREEESLKLIQHLHEQEKAEEAKQIEETLKLANTIQQQDSAELVKIREQKAAKEKEAFSCTICYCAFEEQDDEIIPLSSCEHVFHSECLQEYIEDQIGQLKLNILCADANCGKKLGVKDIEACVSKEKFQKFMKFTFNNFVDSEEKIQWCPKPGCTYAFAFENQHDFECPLCNGHYCIECRFDYHPGYSCQDYAQNKDKIEEDRKDGTSALRDFAKSQGLKQCPKCKSFVEKKQGCDYIPCKCGCKWCFKCVVAYVDQKCPKCGMKHALNELNQPLVNK